MKKTLATVALVGTLMISSTAQAGDRNNWIAPFVIGTIIGNILHNNQGHTTTYVQPHVTYVQPPVIHEVRPVRRHVRCERHWETRYDSYGHPNQSWYKVCTRNHRRHSHRYD